MSKTFVKNIIYLLILAIVNTLAIIWTEEYTSANFIVNILFANVSILAAYCVDMLFSKKKDALVNNVIMSIICYVYVALTVILSLVFIHEKVEILTVVIVQLVIL